MTNVKQFNEKTNGLIYVQNNERKTLLYKVTQQQATTTELHTPDLEMYIQNVAGLIMIAGA